MWNYGWMNTAKNMGSGIYILLAGLLCLCLDTLQLVESISSMVDNYLDHKVICLAEKENQ